MTATEISRGSARIIGPEVRLILAEGNYLTLDADPWRSLRPCFDATVLIDVPEAELRRRLRQRWLGYRPRPKSTSNWIRTTFPTDGWLRNQAVRWITCTRTDSAAAGRSGSQ